MTFRWEPLVVNEWPSFTEGTKLGCSEGYNNATNRHRAGSVRLLDQSPRFIVVPELLRHHIASYIKPYLEYTYINEHTMPYPHPPPAPSGYGYNQYGPPRPALPSPVGPQSSGSPVTDPPVGFSAIRQSYHDILSTRPPPPGMEHRVLPPPHDPYRDRPPRDRYTYGAQPQPGARAGAYAPIHPPTQAPSSSKPCETQFTTENGCQAICKVQLGQ